MIAPTHILFGCTIGVLSGATSSIEIAAVAIGAVLPDIDSPQAFSGRITGPIAYWINKRFGHRKFLHSLTLWLPLFVLAWSFRLPYLLLLGVMSHIFLDLFNRSGVELFSPMTSKIFVCLNYKNRIQTASKAEYILIALLIISLLGSVEIARAGGARMAFARLIGSYSLVYDRYIEAGDRICFIDCVIRLKSGSIVKRNFLIIGTLPNNEGGLALYNPEEEKIYNTKDFQILSCYLTITSKDWNSIRIDKETQLLLASKSDKAQGFWYDEKAKTWKEVIKNEPVSGLVVYNEGAIEVKNDSFDIFSKI